MSTPSLTLRFQVLSAGANDERTPAVVESAETRALGGDTAAWDELFRQYNRRVVLILLSRGIRADAAQDLAQEAWTRLVEQQRRGRLPRLVLPGLVVKQAMFLARDRARRGDARFRHVPLDDVDHGVDFEASLIARDRLDRARVVLGDCSASQQRVFRAIYARPGVSASEVASEVGLSVQRVRQIVCEVRKKLRGAMENNDDA
jgi:RNA polymerase sigma-70 factor (ECF subfamily)